MKQTRSGGKWAGGHLTSLRHAKANCRGGCIFCSIYSDRGRWPCAAAEGTIVRTGHRAFSTSEGSRSPGRPPHGQ